MNWGNKLLIAFLVFIAGISYLVYRTTQTNFDLVENDYYKQELVYQQKIDQLQQAKDLHQPVSIAQTPEGITLQLPEEMKNKSITGDVWFYCAYDKTRDRKYILQTDSTMKQVFETGSVLPGTYTLKLHWDDGEKKYYTENYLKVK